MWGGSGHECGRGGYMNVGMCINDQLYSYFPYRLINPELGLGTRLWEESAYIVWETKDIETFLGLSNGRGSLNTIGR